MSEAVTENQLQTSKLAELNAMDEATCRDALTRCCGSSRWVSQMIAKRPFDSVTSLFETADKVWIWLQEPDFLEAFSHHPKIGDVDSLRQKFASTQAWASGEQAGVSGADEKVLQALTEGNAAYEAKFGYIFIICATGKSASEMLASLNARLPNELAVELQLAAREQQKITRIRLEKLLS